MIDTTIVSENPDYAWIINLYSEIRNRLLHNIRKDSKTYNQISEDFDIDLFEQMIKHDVFNFDSMHKLIDNTYTWIGRLQSPCRDESLEESKQRVLSVKSAKIVSVFIMEVNQCIDLLDEDIQKFFEIIDSENS